MTRGLNSRSQPFESRSNFQYKVKDSLPLSLYLHPSLELKLLGHDIGLVTENLSLLLSSFRLGVGNLYAFFQSLGVSAKDSGMQQENASLYQKGDGCDPLRRAVSVDEVEKRRGLLHSVEIWFKRWHLRYLKPYPFIGQRSSISFIISSAQRTASAIAHIVAGTRFHIVLSQFPRCQD